MQKRALDVRFGAVELLFSGEGGVSLWNSAFLKILKDVEKRNCKTTMINKLWSIKLVEQNKLKLRLTLILYQLLSVCISLKIKFPEIFRDLILRQIFVFLEQICYFPQKKVIYVWRKGARLSFEIYETLLKQSVKSGNLKMLYLKTFQNSNLWDILTLLRQHEHLI